MVRVECGMCEEAAVGRVETQLETFTSTWRCVRYPIGVKLSGLDISGHDLCDGMLGDMIEGSKTHQPKLVAQKLHGVCGFIAGN